MGLEGLLYCRMPTERIWQALKHRLLKMGIVEKGTKGKGRERKTTNHSFSTSSDLLIFPPSFFSNPDHPPTSCLLPPALSLLQPYEIWIEIINYINSPDLINWSDFCLFFFSPSLLFHPNAESIKAGFQAPLILDTPPSLVSPPLLALQPWLSSTLILGEEALPGDLFFLNYFILFFYLEILHYSLRFFHFSSFFFNYSWIYSCSPRAPSHLLHPFTAITFKKNFFIQFFIFLNFYFTFSTSKSQCRKGKSLSHIFPPFLPISPDQIMIITIIIILNKLKSF